MKSHCLDQSRSTAHMLQPTIAGQTSGTLFAAHPLLGLQGTSGNQAANQWLKNQRHSTQWRGATEGNHASDCQHSGLIFQGLSHSLGQSLLPNIPIQPKLTIGQPNDRYEREADQVSALVVEQLGQQRHQQRHPIHTAQRPNPSKVCMISRLQRQISVPTTGGGERAASTGLESAIQQARGHGQALEEQIRLPMEQAFGVDFSQVRLHTDAKSHLMNQQLRSRAFTSCQDIFLRQGEYRPNHSAGQSLLAHELAHVLQQTGGVSHSQVLHSTPPRIQRLLYVGGKEYQNIGGKFQEITDKNRKAKDIDDPYYRQVGILVDDGKGERIEVPNKPVTKSDDPWNNNLIQNSKFREEIEKLSPKEVEQIKGRLSKWMTRKGEISPKEFGGKMEILRGKKSENRIYQSWADVGAALLGEQRARKNKIKEKELAVTVSKNKQFRQDLADVLIAVHAWIDKQYENTKIWKELDEHSGGKFAYWFPKGHVKERMKNAQSYKNHPSSNFVILHEVMFSLIEKGLVDVWGVQEKKPKLGHINMPNEEETVAHIGAASFEKSGQHALIEKHPFVKAARARNLPLGAGASNTTDALMIFAGELELSSQHKEAIAWAAFIFWNKSFKQILAVRHTFHEVMDVASLRTGREVEYDPDSEDPYNVGYARKGLRREPAEYKFLDANNPDLWEEATEENSNSSEYPGSRDIDNPNILTMQEGGEVDPLEAEVEVGVGIFFPRLGKALSPEEVADLRENQDVKKYFKLKQLKQILGSVEDLSNLARVLNFSVETTKNHLLHLIPQSDEGSANNTGGETDKQQTKISIPAPSPAIVPSGLRSGQPVNHKPVVPSAPLSTVASNKQRLDAEAKRQRELRVKQELRKQRVDELKRNKDEELKKARARVANLNL